MSRSTVSRRVREFVGVALFGAAIIWIIALVSYEPADPVWFFSTGGARRPGQLRRPDRRVPRRALVPAVRLRLVHDSGRPHRHRLAVLLVPRRRRGGHEGHRRDAAVRLHQRVSEPRLRHARGVRQAVPRRRLRRRLAREGAVRLPQSHRLGRRDPDAHRPGDHHVDAVLVRPVLRGDLRGDRRRRRAGARLVPRMARGAPARETAPRGDREAHEEGNGRAGAPESRRLATGEKRAVRSDATKREADEERSSIGRARLRVGTAKSFAPPKPPKVSVPAPPLPLSDPEPTTKAPAERRKGDYALPPLALLDAPKTERKIDERELMDGARLLEEKCREFSVEGSVVQIHPGPVVTTFEFKPDAGVKYSKITEPRRRPVPGDAGRVGPDRPDSRQVDRRHPDPEPQPRADLPARDARVRGVPALDVEAHAGARQDHPRRAVHGRPRGDAASADRRIDRRRQVGRHQRHADEHPLPRDARRRADDHDRSEAAGARACTTTSRT